MLGLQTITWTEGVLAYCLQAQVRALKTLVPDPVALHRIIEAMPDCEVTYRHYVSQEEQAALLADSIGGPARFTDAVLKASEPARAYIHMYEQLNEPPNAHWPLDTILRYVDFQCRVARIMHAEGCKVLAGSWSVGQPQGLLLDDNDRVLGPWPETMDASLNSALFRRGLAKHWSYQHDAIRESDGISLHEYGAPRMWDGQTYLCLRYRRVWDVLPPDCRKPLYITELGVDAGVMRDGPGLKGWRYFGYSEEDYVQQLQWYLDNVRADRKRGIDVRGLHIFQVGSLDPQWETFSIAGCNKVAALIREQPAMEPIEKEEEETMANYAFTLGFASFAQEYPEVGLPTSELIYDAHGNGFQYTEAGKLEWNRERNQVLFFRASLTR